MRFVGDGGMTSRLRFAGLGNSPKSFFADPLKKLAVSSALTGCKAGWPVKPFLPTLRKFF
jgi:hypothetical protein